MLELFLYGYKSNLFLVANPQWRGDIGDGQQTLRSEFDSFQFTLEITL